MFSVQDDGVTRFEHDVPRPFVSKIPECAAYVEFGKQNVVVVVVVVVGDDAAVGEPEDSPQVHEIAPPENKAVGVSHVAPGRGDVAAVVLVKEYPVIVLGDVPLQSTAHDDAPCGMLLPPFQEVGAARGEFPVGARHPQGRKVHVVDGEVHELDSVPGFVMDFCREAAVKAQVPRKPPVVREKVDPRLESAEI